MHKRIALYAMALLLCLGGWAVAEEQAEPEEFYSGSGFSIQLQEGMEVTEDYRDMDNWWVIQVDQGEGNPHYTHVIYPTTEYADLHITEADDATLSELMALMDLTFGDVGYTHTRYNDAVLGEYLLFESEDSLAICMLRVTGLEVMADYCASGNGEPLYLSDWEAFWTHLFGFGKG